MRVLQEVFEEIKGFLPEVKVLGDLKVSRRKVFGDLKVFRLNRFLENIKGF